MSLRVKGARTGRGGLRNRMCISLSSTPPPSSLPPPPAYCTAPVRRNALHARQREKKNDEGNASRCYKYIYRAIAVVRCFVNNVSSTRYPFPLSLLRDANWTRPFRGNNSSEGTFMRAGARLLSSPFLPLRDFFRVASPLPRRFARTHALKNVLSRRSFPPPRFADEKRSSSIYFIPSPFLFHGFVWRPPLSRTSLDSRESFLFNKLE